MSCVCVCYGPGVCVCACVCVYADFCAQTTVLSQQLRSALKELMVLGSNQRRSDIASVTLCVILGG